MNTIPINENIYETTSEEEISVSSEDIESTYEDTEDVYDNSSSSNEENICRICFDGEEENNPLIYPCSCDGSSKYVHKKCLDKWRLLNHNKRAFIKCMECHSPYTIIYSQPREIFKVPNDFINVINSPIGLIYTNISLFFLSLFYHLMKLWTKDKTLFFDGTATEEFTQFIENPGIYKMIFYYAYIIVFVTINLFIIFIIISNILIKNHYLYWKNMICYLLLYGILSSHFFSLYYLFKNYTNHSPDIFLNFELIFSSFNIWVFCLLLNKHNKIIDKLNIQNAGEVINRNIEVISNN